MKWNFRGKHMTRGAAPATTPLKTSTAVFRRRAPGNGDRPRIIRPRQAIQTGAFSQSKFWFDQLMNWAMKDPAFKMQLFRFIDVFPMLDTPEMVHDYLVDYLSQPRVTLPPAMQLGLKAGGLAKGLFAKTIAGRITAMARNFIAGVDAADALSALEKLWNEGIGFSVDLLGEACVSHAEARAYQDRYLDLVEKLPATVAKWPANPKLETDHIGPVPRTNVSIKISSLSARTDAIDFKGSLLALSEALKPILQAAARNGVLREFRHGTIRA